MWPLDLMAAGLVAANLVAAGLVAANVVIADLVAASVVVAGLVAADLEASLETACLEASRSEGASSGAAVVRRRSSWSSAFYCCSLTTILKVVDVLFLFVDDLQGRRGRFCCWRCCTESAISCTKRAE